MYTDINVDYSKFEKPKARGSLNDYSITGKLNTALARIHEVMTKAADLDMDDDAFLAISRPLTESQRIINSVVRRMEDDTGDNEDGDDTEW